MRKLFLISLIAAFSLGWISINTSYAADANKVVYHINLGNEQATDALRNIKNHLAVDPTVKIVVVTHSAGVDFLLDGAEDNNKNPYSIAVEPLAAKGVEFRVCQITLERRKIDPKKVIPQAKLVPSGVVEVTKLQQQGYAYLKP
ncbi:MAG: DsrE family protein [Gammaproteobacteria bacterium]|nr:DsrE family protein [Gammaproteobacteria bacterium]MBI5783413.1 DsrE family protein [Gammaproteobacteria bacterium]